MRTGGGARLPSRVLLPIIWKDAFGDPSHPSVALPVFQPENIYEFGARYFSELVEERNMAGTVETINIAEMSAAEIQEVVFSESPRPGAPCFAVHSHDLLVLAWCPSLASVLCRRKPGWRM